MSETMTRTRPRISHQAKHHAITGWLFALPFVLLFCLVFLAPTVQSVRAGFYRMVSSGGLFGKQEETFVGFQNFQEVATNPRFWKGMGRVMTFGAIQIPVMILSALVLALLLDSYLVRRRAMWRLAFFLPFAIPGLVAAIMWGYLYLPETSPLAGSVGVDFLSPRVMLFSMANITTWTFTGYNADLPGGFTGHSQRPL